MIPGALPRDLLQVPEGDFGLAEYGAHVLAEILESAVHYHDDGGLLVDYEELPGAIGSLIADHFGLAGETPADDVLAADAKNPVLAFTPDRAAKQLMADDEIRSVTDRIIGPAYASFRSALAAQRREMHHS
jgi:hypothetical protein